MKLDFIVTGSRPAGLLRLFDFAPAEAGQLLAVVNALASGSIERFEIHRLPFVDAQQDCQLTFVPRKWDQFVIRIGTSSFECGLTPGGWDGMAAFIEPFAAGKALGYQWLTDTPSEVHILLSPTGEW